MAYVETLKEAVGLFKVGLELFISQGSRIIKAIRDVSGAGIFLDLKLHDIPATVQRAFRAAFAHKPAFVTVHCDEGGEILKSVEDDNPGNTKILAIIVLASLRCRMSWRGLFRPGGGVGQASARTGPDRRNPWRSPGLNDCKQRRSEIRRDKEIRTRFFGGGE